MINGPDRFHHNKVWNNEFESHAKKLQAIPDYLATFNENTSSKSKKELKRLKIFLQQLSKKKLESFYVDWNGNQKKWFYFDDLEKELQKHALAEDALKSTS